MSIVVQIYRLKNIRRMDNKNKELLFKIFKSLTNEQLKILINLDKFDEYDLAVVLGKILEGYWDYNSFMVNINWISEKFEGVVLGNWKEADEYLNNKKNHISIWSVLEFVKKMSREAYDAYSTEVCGGKLHLYVKDWINEIEDEWLMSGMSKYEYVKYMQV